MAITELEITSPGLDGLNEYDNVIVLDEVTARIALDG